MSAEDFSEESPLEKRVKALREKVESIEDSVSKGREILARWSSNDSEHKEISTIIDGLFEKARVLAEQNKVESSKIPETDEELDRLIARMDRIQNIYNMIGSLSSDLENVEQKMSALEREFDNPRFSS